MNNIENLIFDTIDEINAQTPPDKQLAKSPDTVIVGEGSILDSLGIVNFFVSLEEKVATASGQSVSLLNDDSLGNTDGPMRTVALIENYICKQI